MMTEHYKPDRWTKWDIDRANERDMEDERKMRSEFLQRIAAGDPEPRLRSEMPPRRWNHAPHTVKRIVQRGPNAIGMHYAEEVTIETGAIVLNHTASLSSERSVIMINPTERSHYTNCFHRGWGPYVLWFGSCGATYLHVYASGLDEAVEKCAEWLAEHAPGYIMKEGSAELDDLRKEACEEAGLAWPMPDDLDDDERQKYWDAFDEAQADLTYTESGYLTSYEWGVELEMPDAETLFRFVWNER